MKVFIVEDEKLAAERLERVLNEIDPAIDVIGVTRSVRDAVAYLLCNPMPDLILMDIELNDGQAFDIFNKVVVTSFVVFTTSYSEHALRAFQQNSLDYLLKPIRKEDLEKSLQKYYSMQQLFVASYSEAQLNAVRQQIQTALVPNKFREHFLIQQGQRYHTIAVTDIAFFFVDGRLAFLVTHGNLKLVVPYSLEEIETMLDPEKFYRANRTYIIQQKAVCGISKGSNGKLCIALYSQAHKEVIVSKQRATDFKQWMNR